MTLDLAEIVERATLFVGVPEARGHLDVLARDVLALAEEVRTYQRVLVEHHGIHNLSDDAIRDSIGRTCQVCVRALSRVPAEEAAE